DILGVGNMVPSRSKRSLLVPPMIITENQRAPFPRVIGKEDQKVPFLLFLPVCFHNVNNARLWRMFAG
ncbi:hypothetical protein JOQ06_003320, partial [Pogonophryne albipinna]